MDRLFEDRPFTFAMLEEAVDELSLSHDPTFRYRIDENDDPLSFDIQFGWYNPG